MSQCLDGQSVPAGIPGEGAVGKSQDGDDHEEDEDAADPGEDVSTLKTEKQNFHVNKIFLAYFRNLFRVGFKF